MMPSEMVAPLLNEYKYGLLLMRLAQTVTGGLKIQRVPCYMHIIQWLLWLLPFIIALPLIGSSFVWNEYYLATLYGTINCFIVFITSSTIRLINFKTKSYRHDDSNIENTNFSHRYQMTHFIFAPKYLVNIIIHALISGLTCFAGFILLDIPVLLDYLPIPAIVFVVIFGWLALSVAHYSLLVQPPHEIMIYRAPHEDRFQLRFIQRPFYIVILGVVFIILRHTISSPSLYICIIYSLFCLLPLLWIGAILPPIDSLILWCMEQCLVHIMGGTPLASELRLILMFFISLVSTVSVAAITDAKITIILATILGFILSQNILVISQWTLSKCRFGRQSMEEMTLYISYCVIRFMKVSTLRQWCIKYILTTSVNIVLLLASIVIVYFTGNSNVQSVIVTVFGAVIIGLTGLVEILRNITRIYCLGIRNPLHLRNINSIKKIKFTKTVHRYISLPYQILLLYVCPLSMVTYIGLTITINPAISYIWFGIVTIRILRKIWQNTTLALWELSIIALLDLILPANSSWIQLNIGTQAVIIGLSIEIVRNAFQNIQLYIILLYSFITDSKQHTRHYLHTLLTVLLLIPFSCTSIIISSLLSSPLLPIFTLPILMTSFPRPKSYWPHLCPKSFTSEGSEAVFYKQAQHNIIKIVSSSLKSGILRFIQPGEVFLARFQDRLTLIYVIESGYGYWSIAIQGLELQETSCHNIEATQIDNIIDSAYTRNHKSLDYWFNQYIMNHFTLLDVNIALVYSDAHNTLSGIIDQPENLTKFSFNLYKILIWTLLKHISCHEIVEQSVKIDQKFEQVERSDQDIEQDDGIWSDSISSLSSHHVFKTPSNVFPDRHNLSVRPSEIQLQEAPTKIPSVHFNNKILPIDTILSLTVPVSTSDIAPILEQIPLNWFNFVLNHFNISSQLKSTQALQLLIAFCYGLIDIPASGILYNLTSSATRPVHLYKGFHGNFILPLGAQADMTWLKQNSTLYNLVLKSYRYAVKLLYDEAVFGKTNNFAELRQYLQEYDNEWFIGREDENWQRAILKETLHLFSMDFKKNTYSAHLLSLQDEVLHLGRLNPSVIKGVWSNLSWELHYLTNDDDERYSIQAHSRLLRNILTQSADIPLGYYVYNSSPITVSSI